MRARLFAIMAAAGLLGLTVAPTSAQTTFDACYVPDVGALYLINQSGLPTSCLSADHVPVSWTDGAGVTDHGELSGLADDDHPEYVREGEAAAGDLTGSFPGPSVAGLQGNALSRTAPSDGQVLTWNGRNSEWEPQAPPTGGTDHGGLSGLADDDHGQYLLVDGVRNATDGFAVTGTLETGEIPVEGAGVRLMWYPGKAAFRAGEVGAGAGTRWDDAEVGPHSVAFGEDTRASGLASTALGRVTSASGRTATAMGSYTSARGLSSTALGDRTVASGDWSTAMGTETTASGSRATAMGDGTTASAGAATAMGFNTTASGGAATAMGNGTSASGTSATAMGAETTASGQRSTAMGLETIASGDWATAMGGGTTASARSTTAMGSLTTASGFAATAMGSETTASGEGGATAMGDNTTAQAHTSLVIGRFNVVEGNRFSWVDTDPLFVAGNGTEATASNALTLLKNGDLSIAGTLTESSDARLKDAIEPLGHVLEHLRSIEPVRFRFRDGTGHPAGPQIGLLAQEVEAVFPELVTRDRQGYLSLAYPKLTAILVKAIQEQQEQIEERDEALEAMRLRNERMADRLDRLEEAVQRVQERDP